MRTRSRASAIVTAAEDVAQDVFVAAVTLDPEPSGSKGTGGAGVVPARLPEQGHRPHPARRAVSRELGESSALVRAGSERIAEINLESDRVRAAMIHLTDEQQDILVRRFVLDQSSRMSPSPPVAASAL